MRAAQLLVSLAFFAIVNVNLGVEFLCSYKIVYWGNVGSVYSCEASVNYRSNPSRVDKISGSHLQGKKNDDVKSFYIISFYYSLDIIPKGIENFFPNLEVFQWYGGTIPAIDLSFFEPLPNLLHIDFMNNKIVKLDGNLFQFTRKLREINFSGNLLEQVGYDLLTGLNNLSRVYFENDLCIDTYANTPDQIEDLNLQLPILCPHSAPTPTQSTSTTTQPDSTSTTTQLASTSPISTTTNPNECPNTCALNDRMEEIEKQVRELNSSPCTCKLTFSS